MIVGLGGGAGLGVGLWVVRVGAGVFNGAGFRDAVFVGRALGVGVAFGVGAGVGDTAGDDDSDDTEGDARTPLASVA